MKQVGNAVPPHLGWALRVQIKAASAGKAELRDSALPGGKEAGLTRGTGLTGDRSRTSWSRREAGTGSRYFSPGRITPADETCATALEMEDENCTAVSQSTILRFERLEFSELVIKLIPAIRSWLTWAKDRQAQGQPVLLQLEER